MTAGSAHIRVVTQSDGPILRKSERLTKDRAKKLLAQGLDGPAGTREGQDRLALAGGCTRRYLQDALARISLPRLDIVLNMLDEDDTILAPLLAAKGKALVDLDAQPDNDTATLADTCRFSSELAEALSRGRRSPQATLALADRLTALMPRLEAYIQEAAAIRERP